MASKRTIKEAWEEDDKELVSLYDMDLDHPDVGLPRFGSDHRIEQLRDAHVEAARSTMGEAGRSPLTRGKRIRESSTLPTILNLAWYFHCIDAAVLEWLRKSTPEVPGLTDDITRLLLKAGEMKFFKERVEPLRDFLEWKYQIYFYCLPAAIYETQLVGGKGWRSDGPEVLAMLPKFPDVALSRGEQPARLIPFGGLVLWLVRSHLCVNCKTPEKMEDLRNVIGAWKPYVNGFHFIEEVLKIEKNNRFLITEQVKKELLPPEAFDLLRLPASREERQNG